MKIRNLTLTLAMTFGLSLPVVAEESGGHGDGHSKEPTRTGKEIAQTCAACHGEKGISASEGFPHLAGQHKSYLVQALIDYKSGKREHQIMNQMASNLTHAEIEAVSEYFANMDGLVTPSR